MAAMALSVTVGQVLNYPYTGSKTSVVLPRGTYRLEAWGAQGGYRSSATYGGKGGYSVGTLTLTAETTIYIYPGGAGNTVTTVSSNVYQGGFNGGGYRYAYKGGGGASDFRIGRDSLYARVLVAGGGGSDGASNKTGLYGGGLTGGAASESYGSYGYGGTQTGHTTTVTMPSTQPTTNSSSNYPGGFGFGGFGIYRSSGYGGAGGGGWYGGCGSYPDNSGDDDRGGGGGSGYVYTSSTASNYPSGCLLNSSYYLTNAATYAGNVAFTDYSGSGVIGHSGDGACRITVLAIPVKPPTNLTGTVVNKMAKLSWSASSEGADSYKVYSGTTLLGTTTSLTYEYAVNPDTDYTFKVTAYKEGAESDAISISIRYSLPLPPTGLNGILVDGIVYLTWSASVTSGVTGYRIYYEKNPDGNPTGSTSSLEYEYDVLQRSRFSDLPVMLTKMFRVTSVATVGESPTYAAISIIIPDLPDPPSGLTATIVNQVATINWNSSTYEYLNGYRVYIDGVLFAITQDTTVNPYLSPGTEHLVEVYSYNDTGNSPTAATITVYYDLPSPPPSISAEMDAGDILVSWTDSADSDVTAYRVYLGDVLLGTTPWIPKLEFPIENNSFSEKLLLMGELGDLKEFSYPANVGEEYTFRVSAVSPYGESVETRDITVRCDATLKFSGVSVVPNPVNTSGQISMSVEIEELYTLTVIQ